MKDFLTFRKMIAPILIQVMFWLAVVFFIYTGVLDIIHQVNIRIVIEILILGPLVARIICEILILFFRIHEDILKIKNDLHKK